MRENTLKTISDLVGTIDKSLRAFEQVVASTNQQRVGIEQVSQALQQIRTGSDVIARYTTDQLRLLVHWDAELYTDLADLRQHVDHTDDLTPDRVFETFVADLRAKGVPFEVPSDPMRDPRFIALLATTYDVPPASYPAEAPVAAHAA